MEITKAQRDVLAGIGATLIQIQRTEFNINASIKHVVPKTLPLSKIMQDGERRPPLGQLIEEFKRHVIVSDSFAATLAEYLSCRNQFAHTIEFVPGWNLSSRAGIEAANKFLERMAALDSKVDVAFSALHRSLAVAEGDTPRKKGKFPYPKSDKFYLELARSLFPNN